MPALYQSMCTFVKLELTDLKDLCFKSTEKLVKDECT